VVEELGHGRVNHRCVPSTTACGQSHHATRRRRATSSSSNRFRRTRAGTPHHGVRRDVGHDEGTSAHDRRRTRSGTGSRPCALRGFFHSRPSWSAGAAACGAGSPGAATAIPPSRWTASVRDVIAGGTGAALRPAEPDDVAARLGHAPCESARAVGAGCAQDPGTVDAAQQIGDVRAARAVRGMSSRRGAGLPADTRIFQTTVPRSQHEAADGDTRATG